MPSGEPQLFGFTLTGGPDAVSSGADLTDEAAAWDSGPVRPGTYAASESAVGGDWDLDSASCSDGRRSAGARSLRAAQPVD